MIKTYKHNFQEDCFMIQKKIGVILFLASLMFITNALAQQLQPSSTANATLADMDTTIWKYLAASDRSRWIITRSDSERAYRDYLIPGYNIFRAFNEIWDKIGKKKLAIEDEASNLISLLEQVKDYFEEGLRLNPFENTLRTGITTTYFYLEMLYNYKKESQNRLQMLQNLLYLKKNPQDRLNYFNNIGMIYRQYEMWEPARDNFQLAVKAIFEDNESAIDTTKLFDNLFRRGEAEFHLYEAEAALSSFTHARMIAPNENWYNQLTARIDYINWDDGNIGASEKFNEALHLNNEKKYHEAELVFLELLGMVTTEKARNQAQLSLAKMQFYSLDKKDEAIDRLWNLANKYPLDSDSNAAVDSTAREIWEQYSQMCLRMGVDYYNTDKRSSFTYFIKASQLEGSSLRGQAFLNLARISLQNPQICLTYCMRALDYQERLRPEEKQYLYQTIYQAYLKQGDFEQALKWYRKYFEMAS